MITQKATILCIYEILKKYSDEDHIISADKIIEKLKLNYDVDMERRAVYRNIDALRSFGIEIEGYKDNREGYYLIDREFELSEVRLLCDAIASSERLNEKDGKKIIEKLIDSQSIFQRRMLRKTFFVKKESNIVSNQLFYNIDALNAAISQGCKVRSQLLEYNFEQELIEKETVVLSPYVTLWADAMYYIVAKREESDELEHFRIDLMRDIRILEREIDMIFGGINPEQYAEKCILQNKELRERFEIKCEVDLWQEIVEKFGTDATAIKIEKGYVTVRFFTILSKMETWVMQNLDKCKVLAPTHFYEKIQVKVSQIYKEYWN